MSKEVQTAPCRFCGQMVQIEAEGKLTEPQAAEEATMHCTCAEAVEYQKEKQRKEKAMKMSPYCSERMQHRTRESVRTL